MAESQARLDWTLPAFFTRVMVGLVFAMAGFWKVFTLTPAGHAHRYFLDRYADSWIPTWLLWLTGVTVPIVELVAGALLIVGLWRRASAFALGVVLLLVTYGHLLAEPLYDVHPYIVTRLALLLPTLLLSAADDPWSVDGWRMRKAKLPAVMVL
jgi:uncharacterized membrane protein YphA (DoxX/SURF4 family)